jgi:integrase
MIHHSVIIQYHGLSRAVKYSTRRRSPSPYVYLCFPGPDGRRLEQTSKVCTERAAHEVAASVIQEAYSEIEQPPPKSWDEAWRMLEDMARGHKVAASTLALYKITIASLRKTFPDLAGPAQVTDRLARQYKALRAASVKPSTLAVNLQQLRVIFGKWWLRETGVVSDNPFEDVEEPLVKERKKVVLTPAEEDAFLSWLLARWKGWRLPYLFVATKAAIGSRTLDLASAESSWLRDGRLCFPASALKGRVPRDCLLPPALYQELQALAGPRYVWESWRLRPGAQQPEFRPVVFGRWLRRQLKAYLDEDASRRRFRLHDLRGTAMTRYLNASGGDWQGGAIAFGCDPETMKNHYVELDRGRIADKVFATIQARYA